jgi:AAA domain
MSATRPYIRKSAAELEALCDASKHDPLVLRTLQAELSLRTTSRAMKLRKQVDQYLFAIAHTEKTNPLPNNSPAPLQHRHTERKSDEVPVPNQRQQSPVEPPRQAPKEKEATPPPRIRTQPVPPERATTSPVGSNEPASLLAAWTALEALSPQTYRRPEDLAAGDRSCVVDLTLSELPWVRGETSRPNRQLYYQIVLGAIPMDRATDELIRAFGEDDERSRRELEKAAIAVLLVDRKGILLDENAVGISSFSWALPVALQRQLGALGAWVSVEKTVIQQLENRVRRSDENGNPIPIDRQLITEAYNWLVQHFRLPSTLVEPPSFALRVFHYYRSKAPPEVALLNSFFLADLTRATESLKNQKLSPALRRYLGVDFPTNAVNLFDNKAALEAIVAPAMQPAARWPSPGGHPLVTLQQAAVNVARHELSGKEGIISVNGPPGTGKTTLLRDIVAACVLDRALAMAKFDDPSSAFKASGQRMKAGDSAFFHLYKLDESLGDHEVLVASRNNKAVENVSKELPALKAIGRSIGDLSYFRTVSDQLLAPVAEWGDEHNKGEHVATWGLIAAVLGNAKNRGAFQQNLWWHEDNALRLYLKAAKGDSVVREIKNESGDVIRREIPTIIKQERPPSTIEISGNWVKARRRLLERHSVVEQELKALEHLRHICLQLAQERKILVTDSVRHAKAVVDADVAHQSVRAIQAPLDQATTSHKLTMREVATHLEVRPGWLARLFRTLTWTDWVKRHESLLSAEREASAHAAAIKREFDQAEDAAKSLLNASKAIAASLGETRQKITNLTNVVDLQRKILGDRIVDQAYFERGHEAWNLTSPWLPDSLHKKREELFIAAMAVHKAFIDASAQKILHNLSVLMSAMTAGSFPEESKRGLLGDLWSTLFLVVPVVSTTFASVDRMLGDLPAGSIGWLLVDEAGQALPQAAVGALMRAKRAIVVGDPLQIPPVVSLPARLSAEVCAFFKVSADKWVAPEASAQTVADAASRFRGAFRSDQGFRQVGVPLLVHRRCQEPMFGISNRIAYDSQMVHAPGARDSGDVGRVLGSSAWLNHDGEASTKWCASEGEILVKLLIKVAKAGVVDPDIYVITPFRIVAEELRRRLEKETKLFDDLGVDQKEWIKNRVGTVHTFQGKEAETVIVVLGAPNAAQGGARNWATSIPNLLNVTVSRAKQNLYVVGSHSAWSSVGHGRELGRSLPIANV